MSSVLVYTFIEENYSNAFDLEFSHAFHTYSQSFSDWSTYRKLEHYLITQIVTPNEDLMRGGKKYKACRRHYSLNHLLVTLGRYLSAPICVCMDDENHFFSTNHFFIMIDITERSIFSFSHFLIFLAFNVVNFHLLFSLFKLENWCYLLLVSIYLFFLLLSCSLDFFTFFSSSQLLHIYIFFQFWFSVVLIYRACSEHNVFFYVCTRNSQICELGNSRRSYCNMTGVYQVNHLKNFPMTYRATIE